ncbi:MAG: hypothetical protein IBJ00_03645, partial [Alphaproteobacteria bacterium]|nr:hypothetical protein [Alphaproteobacteria bacterium]
MKKIYLVAVTFLTLIFLGYVQASYISNNQEQTLAPKKTALTSSTSFKNESFVKEKVQMYERLGRSSTEGTPILRPHASRFEKSVEPSSSGRVKKLSSFFQRSKSTGHLPKLSQPLKQPSVRKTSSADTASSSSPKQPHRFQKMVSSFTELPSPKGLRRWSPDKSRKSNKGSSPKLQDDFTISRPTINQTRTLQQDFDPLDHTSIERKLEQKVRHCDMLIKTIEAHLERGTIDRNSNGYLYVLKPDLEELEKMHVIALRYLTGKDSIKRRNKNREDVTNIVQNMGRLTGTVGEWIYCLTGDKKSAIFDKKLEDAERQLKGEKDKEKLKEVKKKSYEVTSRELQGTTVLGSPSKVEVRITHP